MSIIKFDEENGQAVMKKGAKEVLWYTPETKKHYLAAHVLQGGKKKSYYWDGDRNFPEGNEEVADLMMEFFETVCNRCDRQFYDEEEKKQYQVLLASLCKNLNVNLRDAEGRTPLHVAAQYGQFDAMQELMKRGANALAKTKGWLGFGRKTPKHMFLDWKKKNTKKLKTAVLQERFAEREAAQQKRGRDDLLAEMMK